MYLKSDRAHFLFSRWRAEYLTSDGIGARKRAPRLRCARAVHHIWLCLNLQTLVSIPKISCSRPSSRGGGIVGHRFFFCALLLPLLIHAWYPLVLLLVLILRTPFMILMLHTTTRTTITATILPQALLILIQHRKQEYARVTNFGN